MNIVLAEQSVKLGVRNQVTIPSRIAKLLKLHKGMLLEVREEEGRVVMNPQILVPREDAWFWSPEWQAKEREADEEMRMGRFHGPYTTAKDLQKALDRLKKK